MATQSKPPDVKEVRPPGPPAAPPTKGKAKYLLKAPAYVTVQGVEVYFEASPQDPKVYRFPLEVEPSVTWVPLNDAAKQRIKDVKQFRALDPKEKERISAEREEKRQEEANAKAVEEQARLEAELDDDDEAGDSAIARAHSSPTGNVQPPKAHPSGGASGGGSSPL